MAFQTNILRNGEWVTQTVNLQAALKASEPQEKTVEPEKRPPACGLLSRTIIESPIVQWIIPVRLRSQRHNDIAFIGSNSVQINELHNTGQMNEVLVKNDFDLRIRNALVIGYELDHGMETEEHSRTDLLDNDDPVPQATRWSAGGRYWANTRELPPQMLVLILETGELVFLFIRKDQNGHPEFVTTKQDTPRGIKYLGYHFTVDPSSRYMAAASPEGLLVVYELEDMDALEAQYTDFGTIQPIKSARVRGSRGVIQKLEFLWPRPEDDFHIILLLLLARKERRRHDAVARMVTYDWMLGTPLDDVFSEEKPGNRVLPEHQMPLLLIPLRFKTSFLLVSQHQIAIVKDVLSGSAVFEGLPSQAPGPTEYYHGTSEPLWAAWARPFRLRKYFEKMDVIYLAREDGAIQHIEIDKIDLMPIMTHVGCLDTNIDTAFTASLDRFHDLLLVAGDSGPGGTWKVAPRQDLARATVLPNWSPVIDVATTRQSQAWEKASSQDQMDFFGVDTDAEELLRPNELFSASGRGAQGTVTHWRWGLRARVGLDIDLEEPARQAWAFWLDGDEHGGLHVILAMPSSSAVLSFSKDLAQVDAASPGSTPFDLSSTTLAASQTEDGRIVQVTETSVTTIAAIGSTQTLLGDLLGAGNWTAQKASCSGNVAAISCEYGPSLFQLHTISLNMREPSWNSNWKVQGEVTCLLLADLFDQPTVAVGTRLEGTSCVSLYSLAGEAIASVPLLAVNMFKPIAGHEERGAGASELDALTSICLAEGQSTDSASLVLGTRCGHLITMIFSKQGALTVVWTAEKLATAPIEVFSGQGLPGSASAVFARCDNDLMMLKHICPWIKTFKSKVLVWATDFNDPSMVSPPIHSLHTLQWTPPTDQHRISMALLGDSRLLLAELLPQVGPVPRSLPVKGSPTRVVFSQASKCLVVALVVDDRPSLAIIDPESGKIVPEAADTKTVEFIQSLGQTGDRITSLGEWFYIKGEKNFGFILVATRGGQLFVVSATLKEFQTENGPVRRIEYVSRTKKKYTSPVYSIVGDGDGIVFCVGRELQWNVLDPIEKKLKLCKSFELESPATTLRVVNGKIFALTMTHSLQVIDHRSSAMVLLHSDHISRSAIHMMDLGDPMSPASHWPILMLSDLAGGIAGVRVPWGQRQKELATIFEGVLKTGIRRFVRMRRQAFGRPGGYRRLFGILSSSIDDSEVFGVSVSGSMQHFTLLSLELWRLLFLIESLARRHTAICFLAPLPPAHGHHDEGPEPDLATAMLQPEAKRMHIDGDVVERVWKRRMLPQVVGQHFEAYRGCLDQLERGYYTQGFQLTPDDLPHIITMKQNRYYDLGYEILEHLFAPVL